MVPDGPTLHVWELEPDDVDMTVGPSVTIINHPDIFPAIVFKTQVLIESIEGAMGVGEMPLQRVEVTFKDGEHCSAATIAVRWHETGLVQKLAFEMCNQDVVRAIARQAPHIIASSPQGDGQIA